MDWTVDTCVLYEVVEAKPQATYLLMRIMLKQHRVAFDHEGRIRREYETCVRGRENRLVGKWFAHVVSKLAIYFSGRLPNRHRKALEGLGFDRSDWPFVAVCSRTESKNLVSKDSDYTDEVRAYVAKEMDVTVLSIAEASGLAG